MRKFKGFRHRDAFEAECKRRCLPFDATLHDKAFHDHVSIAFTHQGVYGTALVNMFHGLFFGTLEDGTKFSSGSDQYEDQPWFQALLEAVYV